MNYNNTTRNGSWLSSRRGIVLLAFLALAGLFLFTEHRAHLFGILPYILLLACPLLHLFMHRGHGKHGEHSHSEVSQISKEVSHETQH